MASLSANVSPVPTTVFSGARLIAGGGAGVLVEVGVPVGVAVGVCVGVGVGVSVGV